MQQASYHLATCQHYLILIATCLEFHMHTQIATLHSLACLCGYTYLMPIVVACSWLPYTGKVWWGKIGEFGEL